MEKLEHTPMSDKLKERIEKMATQFIKNNFGDSFAAGPYHKLSYIAGATAEHPKAWNDAIDAVIEMMRENPIGLDAIDEEYLEKLEKLKHKHP